MTDKLVVIAVGQTWPDLSIEKAVLGPQGVAVIDGRGLPPDDSAWATASGILLGSAYRLDRPRLEALAGCSAVVRFGMGYDNVDIRTAEDLGIAVGIVRDYCVEEVAEHALAFALSLARALPFWDRNVRSGAWRGGQRPPLHRLSALSFGVLGFGLIGHVVARKAGGLFGRVLVHDSLVRPSQEDRGSGYVFVDTLVELVAQADILSVHVPLTEATRGLLDGAMLARMKPSASVINVSRGGIVDEAALLAAIQAGRLAGAALDTFVDEPVAVTHALLADPRILVSPHAAWLSDEAEIALRRGASEELARMLQGQLRGSVVTKANTRLSA